MTGGKSTLNFFQNSEENVLIICKKVEKITIVLWGFDFTLGDEVVWFLNESTKRFKLNCIRDGGESNKCNQLGAVHVAVAVVLLFLMQLQSTINIDALVWFSGYLRFEISPI